MVFLQMADKSQRFLFLVSDQRYLAASCPLLLITELNMIHQAALGFELLMLLNQGLKRNYPKNGLFRFLNLGPNT